MTLEQAKKIEARFPLGTSIRLCYVKCTGACCKRKGAKGHGPYWIARVRVGPGKQTSRYVGSDAKKTEIDDAHALFRADQAEKDGAEIRELARAITRAPKGRERETLERLLAKEHRPPGRRRGAPRAPAGEVLDVPLRGVAR